MNEGREKTKSIDNHGCYMKSEQETTLRRLRTQSLTKITSIQHNHIPYESAVKTATTRESFTYNASLNLHSITTEQHIIVHKPILPLQIAKLRFREGK